MVPLGKRCPILRKAATGSIALVLLVACGTGNGTGGGTTSADQIAQADAYVAEATQEPSSLPIDEPLRSRPEPGKTVVVMACDAEICGVYDDAFQAAADAVGWNIERVPFKLADPATLNAGLDTALEFEPEAVFLTSVAPELYASKTLAFVDAGVPLITSVTHQSDDPSGLFVDVASTPWQEQHADILANWVTSDSEGEARVMLVKISDLEVFKVMGQRFMETIEDICPGCAVTETDVTYPQFASGQGQDLVLSALRRDPTIDYVVSMSGTLMAGMPAKLEAAGIQDQATLAVAQARELNMADIVSGDLAAATNIPVKTMAWEMFDAALRLSQGMEIDPAPYNEAGDLQLLTEDNVGTPSPTRELPEDYEKQFKALWKVD